LGGIPIPDFVITCNSQIYLKEKKDITTFFTLFIWFDVHIQLFLSLKFSKKLNRGILG
jgi:hypothetical protein